MKLTSSAARKTPKFGTFYMGMTVMLGGVTGQAGVGPSATKPNLNTI